MITFEEEDDLRRLRNRVHFYLDIMNAGLKACLCVGMCGYVCVCVCMCVCVCECVCLSL